MMCIQASRVNRTMNGDTAASTTAGMAMAVNVGAPCISSTKKTGNAMIPPNT